MEEMVIVLIAGLFIFISLWVLFTLDSRVVKKIKEDGKQKKYKIINIRSPNRFDGKSPFKAFDLTLGVSSTMVGVNGERGYNKIVEVEGSSTLEKYWVKGSTVLFIPLQPEWKKIEQVPPKEPYTSVYVFEEEQMN